MLAFAWDLRKQREHQGLNRITLNYRIDFEPEANLLGILHPLWIKLVCLFIFYNISLTVALQDSCYSLSNVTEMFAFLLKRHAKEALQIAWKQILSLESRRLVLALRCSSLNLADRVMTAATQLGHECLACLSLSVKSQRFLLYLNFFSLFQFVITPLRSGEPVEIQI